MTRPEALILLTDDVDETQARTIARAVRATFTRAEGEEWERLANRRRQARHYAKTSAPATLEPNATASVLALGGSTLQPNAKVPALALEPNATASVLALGKNPDSSSLSPAGTPPVPPQDHPPKREPPKGVSPKGSRAATPGPETVPVPEILAAVEGFPPVWSAFIESRRLIREPMTHLAAERLLARLAQRPADAVEALNLCIERQWQSFRWHYLDNERADASGHAPAAFRRPVNGHASPHGKPQEQRDYSDTKL